MIEFKKYDSYKDSGLKWLGDVPSEWEVKRFNDLFEVSQGLQIARSERTDNQKINSVEYITLPSIKGTIKEYIYKPTKNVLCNKNDFLIVRTGSGVGQIITNVKGAFHNNFFKVGVNKKLDRKYIYNLLTTHYVKSLMKIYAGTTAIPDLNHGEFYSIELVLPPIKTQIKIATYLDTKTLKIDKEIKLLEQKSLKYKELKQTLINETILRGVDKDVKLKDSGIDWIGDIPYKWTLLRFEEVLCKKNKKKNINLPCGSISFGQVILKDENKVPTSTKSSYQELLVNEFIINPLNLNFDLKSLRTSLSSLNVIVSSGYIVLKSKNNIDINYLKWLLHQFDISYMKMLGGGIRHTVNFYDIAKELFYKPSSVTEQIKISEYLNKKTKTIDNITTTIKTKITLLKEFRKTLINDTVTGKVKVEND